MREDDFVRGVLAVAVGRDAEVAGVDDGEVFDVGALGVLAVVALTHRCGGGGGLGRWLAAG